MNTFRLRASAVAAMVLAVACDQTGTSAQKQERQDRIPEATDVFQIPLGDSPARGGAAPKVTIVAFSDFQCGFCGKVTSTLAEVTRSYGSDVRLVFKHRPLPFHQRALPAALAAEAAREQDRF